MDGMMEPLPASTMIGRTTDVGGNKVTDLTMYSRGEDEEGVVKNEDAFGGAIKEEVTMQSTVATKIDFKPTKSHNEGDEVKDASCNNLLEGRSSNDVPEFPPLDAETLANYTIGDIDQIQKCKLCRLS